MRTQNQQPQHEGEREPLRERSGADSPSSRLEEPSRDVQTEKAALLRDFVFETLEPIARNVEAARLCLSGDDDVGARYHLGLVVARVRASAKTFRELEALKGSEAMHGVCLK